MELHTTAEVISFARMLENESGKFYEGLSQRYAGDKDAFLSFAQENRKYVVQIERAYYGVITDAIEGCFAFSVNPDAYIFETELVEQASYPEVLGKAIEIERKVVKFYSDAAEQSKPLMADIPTTFTMIAKKRANRILKLRSFLQI